MNNPNNKNFNNFSSNQSNNNEFSIKKKNDTNSNQKEKTSENQNIFNPIKQQINNNYPSDIYAEDSDFEIDSSSKNITDTQRYNNITGRTNSLNKNTNNNNNDNSKSYIEQLEAKIQEQAKRLNDLYKYKILCEKRIKDLNPNEEFPVSEESIKNESKKSSVKDENENKYDELLEKHKKLTKNYNELKEINSVQTDRSNKSNVSIEVNPYFNRLNGNTDISIKVNKS